LSNAEAAQVLGTSVSAFETLLVRARRTLRVKLNLTDDD
jgi:DNA-directed RNA polymerase specialized sigma24 family protein